MLGVAEPHQLHGGNGMASPGPPLPTPTVPAVPLDDPGRARGGASSANVVLERPAGKPSRLEISRANYEFMAKETLKYPHHQTGGELFGLWKTDGTAIVTHVTGPGRHALLAVNNFQQDHEYRAAVAILLRQRASVAQIGEWHSHHQLGKKEPSKGDSQNAVARMCARERPWWVSIITLVDRGSAEVRAYRYTNVGTPTTMMVHARMELALNESIQIGRAITRDDLARMRDVVADANPQAAAQHRQLQEQMRAKAARAQQQRAMRRADPHGNVPTAAVAHGVVHGGGGGHAVPVAQVAALGGGGPHAVAPRERPMLLSRVHGSEFISEEEDRNGVALAAVAQHRVAPQYGGGGGGGNGV